MIASCLIIVLSSCMFVYWFRHSCVLILEMAPPEDHRQSVIDTYGLSSIQMAAAGDGAGNGDLHRLLDRDYRILQDLLTQYPEVASVEHRILMLDYTLMKAWSKVASTLCPDRAPGALMEMAKVLDYFVATIGTAAACEAESAG